MKRTATLLFALLAVVAIAAAAGSFDPAAQPSLDVDRETATLETISTPDEFRTATGRPNRSAPPTPAGPEGGEQVNSAPGGTLPGSGAGGVSPLFVAVFVGALVASAVLAVVLTGDDDRADAPPRPSTEGPADPRPTVDVRYGTPEDNVVVRAWERLGDAVGADDAETPGETARRAADSGVPRDAVAALTDHFRAVRYGDEPLDDDRRRDANEALDRLDGEDEP